MISATEQSKLLARFGPTVLKDGYTVIPNTMLKRQAELHITPVQLDIIVQIWMTWWGIKPCPPIPLIASRIRRTPRAVQINLRKLEKPMIELVQREATTGEEEEDQEQPAAQEHVVRPALLIIRPRHATNGTPLANEYDFSPLLQLIEELEQRDERVTNLDSMVNGIQGNGERDSGVMVNGVRGNGERDSGVIVNGEHESPFPSNIEESRQESFLERDTSNLRKEPSKGSVFENVDNSVSLATQDGNNGYDEDDEEAWYHPPTRPHRAQTAQAQHSTQPGKDTVEHRNPRNQGAEEATARSNLPGWAQPEGEPEPRHKRAYLPSYLETQLKDFSAEFHDEHPASSRTQLARLYGATGVDVYWFGEIIYEARAITKKASVKKTREFMTTGGGVVLRTNRMPYFFKVLRDLLREKGLLEGEAQQP